ncbi:MAG: hypothetical protein HY790_10365 [Deltaproteobacteria bacterium]|nr:hypothetical protein [Deltaproteobacteria bacterium]
MTLPEKIEVVIYDAPAARAGDCGCGCGGHHHQQEAEPLSGANMELQARALALTLEAAFPGRVQVEYINVLKDPRGPGLPQTALLCSLAYPPPLVYLNGQGRFAGALPAERIREEVGKILESKD